MRKQIAFARGIIFGDISRISGDVSGIRGDVSGICGCMTGIKGRVVSHVEKN